VRGAGSEVAAGGREKHAAGGAASANAASMTAWRHARMHDGIGVLDA